MPVLFCVNSNPLSAVSLVCWLKCSLLSWKMFASLQLHRSLQMWVVHWDTRDDVLKACHMSG